MIAQLISENLEAFRAAALRFDPAAVRSPTVTVGEIARATTAALAVSLEEMRSAKRTSTLVLARSVAMLVARRHTEASFPELGSFFRRDHTTVMHAVRKLARLVEELPRGYTADAVRSVEAELGLEVRP